MTHLLDTSVCVTHLRARKASGLLDRARILPAGAIVVCSVVRAELLVGAMRSRDPVGERAKVQQLLALFTSLSFDDAAADHYASARAHLESTGQMIGANDLLIGAIALRHDLTVVTHNTAEFTRIPGLRVEDW